MHDSFDSFLYGFDAQGFSGPYGMERLMENTPIQPLMFRRGGDPNSWWSPSSVVPSISQGGPAPLSSISFDIPSSANDQLNACDPYYLQDPEGMTASFPQTSPYPYTSSSTTVYDIPESLPSDVHPPPTAPYLLHNDSPDSVCNPSHYYGNQFLVEEPQPSYPATHSPYSQILQAQDGAVGNDPIPPTRAIQVRIPTRRNSRVAHSAPGSPYHLSKAPSSPVQIVSPSDMVEHPCRWRNDDGTMCGVPISKLSISEHFIIHGITRMGHDILVECKWKGCRLRGGKKKIKRESIVRHAKEKHLQHKRNTN